MVTFDQEQIYETDEVTSLQMPDSSMQVLMNLGQTVLAAIDAAIAAAIASATQQLATATVAVLEKNLNLAGARAALAAAKAQFDVIDKYKATIAPYMKYLDMVPEVKKPLVTALSFVDNTQAELKSTIMKLQRLTYMSDVANSFAGELSSFISQLLSVRQLIATILAKKNT